MKSPAVVNFAPEPHSVELREFARPEPGPEDVILAVAPDRAVRPVEGDGGGASNEIDEAGLGEARVEAAVGNAAGSVVWCRGTMHTTSTLVGPAVLRAHGGTAVITR